MGSSLQGCGRNEVQKAHATQLLDVRVAAWRQRAAARSTSIWPHPKHFSRSWRVRPAALGQSACLLPRQCPGWSYCSTVGRAPLGPSIHAVAALPVCARITPVMRKYPQYSALQLTGNVHEEGMGRVIPQAPM